jgi:hypothetical protein
MKRILLFLFLLIFTLALKAQDNGESPADIKARMATIRKNTDWNDPEAAKEANAQIEVLSTKLTQAIRKKNAQAKQDAGEASGQGGDQANQDEMNEINQEVGDYNDQLWNQMMKIVREGGEWDMAKPLREEIVQEYKDDEDPTIKSQQWLDSIPYLLINLSMPHVDVVISQMPMFRGIRNLIITADKAVVSADLDQIFRNAKDYPLQRLSIINLKTAVSSLPESIGNFSRLKILELYNNDLAELPSDISRLIQLQMLYVDINPINSLVQVISQLKHLSELGIAKTNISESEIENIKMVLPGCKILEE